MSMQIQTNPRSVIEEVSYRREGIHVSLIVNRRQRTARLVDFLAGNFPLKQQRLDELARREGIARIYTFVEKEESLGWAKVGFAREGTIPGYYKRSDAYLMGRVISDPPLVDEDGAPLTPLADTAAAEKVLVQARKLVVDVTAVKGLKIEVLNDLQATAQGIAPARNRKTAAWFDERFLRSGDRLHVIGRGRTTSQVVTAELQEPFGNAYLQIPMVPTKTDEARVLAGAIHGLHEALKVREIGCTFAMTPADSPLLGAVFLGTGYRRTGVLSQHLAPGERRFDAMLWVRRTAGDGDSA
jgi:hypothetical protein